MIRALIVRKIEQYPAGLDGLDTSDVNAAFWATVGTLATAVFTLLLAVFAYLAWRASAGSLKSMKKQENDNREAVARQIEDQSWGRQMDALNRYLVLLLELLERKPIDVNVGVTDVMGPTGLSSLQYSWAAHQDQLEHHRRLVRELEVAGSVWRLQHRMPSGTKQCLQGAENLLIGSRPTAHQSEEYKNRWAEGVWLMSQGVQDSQVLVAGAEKRAHAEKLFHSVAEAVGLPNAHPSDYGDTGRSVVGLR